MTERLIIMTTSSGSLTPSDRDALTGYLQGRGWHVWHWFEDVWLVIANEDEPIIASTLGLAIREIIKDNFVLIQKVPETDGFYSFTASASAPWLTAHWGSHLMKD